MPLMRYWGLQEDNSDKQLSLRIRRIIYDELQPVSSETNQDKKAGIKTKKKKSMNISKNRLLCVQIIF